VAVVLNKMDLRGFDAKTSAELSAAIQALFRKAGLKAPTVIPVSAKDGDNVLGRSAHMPWYTGQTLLDFILGIRQPEAVKAGARFVVQDVYRFDGNPVVAGKLLSGTLAGGDVLAVCPRGDLVTVQEVRRFPSDTRPAIAGESVGLSLTGQMPERGNVLAPVLEPPTVCTRFTGRVFWLVDAPLAAGEVLTFRCATQSVPVTVDSIGHRVDSSTLDPLPDAPQLAALEVGTARFSAQSPVVLEPFPRVPALGRFILQRNGVPVGAGIILERDG
jgi:sulfate adenylyltransferase subunit 1 (EFTu-like GTPase family)